MAMDAGTIEFQAKEPAYLNLTAPMTLADLDRVFNLYLPFLGPKSYSLYHFLVDEVQAGVDWWGNHYLLLDTLTLSLPDLVHARKALEAVGLLKTYYQAEGVQRGYTYQIQPPMSAKAFFEEDLLAGLLFYYAGEDRFLDLTKRYQGRGSQVAQGANVQDLSTSFLELFDNPSAKTVRPEVKIDEAVKPADLDLKQTSFDFEAMVALTHGTTAAMLAKHRQLIVTQQVLYQLNEAELATAITRNINLDNHDLNRAGFLTYLQNNWAQNKQEKLSATTPDQGQVQPDQAAVNDAATTGTGRKSKALASLYQAANQLSPIDFLRQIKENNHGYVTKAENQILSDLLSKNILPVPVLNILVWQVLVNMDNPDLKRNLMDSIANDWAKSQVKTAPEAIAAIEKHQNRQRPANNNNRSANRNWQSRPTKTEPKMAKNDEIQQATSASVGADELMALLKNRRTKN